MTSYASLARPYARAIFSLALETKQLDAWNSRLVMLCLILDDANALAILQSKKISRTAKAQIFQETFANDKALIRLVTILLEANRIVLVHAIAEGFLQLQRQHRNEELVTLYCAYQLDAQQVQAITVNIEKNIGKKALVQQVTKPELLSGLRIIGEGWRIEANMLAKVESLARRLTHVG